MKMLYRSLKLLSRLLVFVFYRVIRVEHPERVPASGPIILAANHPNTMMDPLLVALLSGRNPYFLGKSTLFNSALSRWFFNAVNVLPVYRKQDAEQHMGKNAEIFEKCFQSLEAGRALVIMPEGISQMDGTLHEIKTGTARIGLGAEARNGFALGLKIVPAGINYSSPTEFFGDVNCRFGRPIELKAYADLFKNDEYEAVYQVTQNIRDALEKLTTTVEIPETAQVLRNLKKIYKMELAVDLGLDSDLEKNDFSVTRGMADAINWYHREHPEEFQHMAAKMTTYLAKIEGLELRDDLLSTARGQRTFARRALGLVGVVLGFPLYLWGLVNNYIPYHIPRVVISLTKPSLEYLSTFKMISGFVGFLLSYFFQTYLIWTLSGSPGLTTMYALSLLPAGRFTLYYQDTMRYYRQHLRLLTLFLSRKTLMLEIIEERIKLIKEIDAAKSQYMNRMEGESDPAAHEVNDEI